MSKPTESYFLHMVASGQLTQAEADEERAEAEIGALWLVETAEDAWISYAYLRDDLPRFAEFLRKHVVKEGDQQAANIQQIVDLFAFRERISPIESPQHGRHKLRLVE